MKRTLVWAVAAAALGLAACGDDDDDNGGAAAPGPQACTPPATATAPFAAIQPILTSRCGSCHGTTFGSADRATAYAAAASRVNTTSPDSSVLLQKGDGRTAHGGGDALVDPAEVTSVTAWIRECAQNN